MSGYDGFDDILSILGNDYLESELENKSASFDDNATIKKPITSNIEFDFKNNNEQPAKMQAVAVNAKKTSDVEKNGVHIFLDAEIVEESEAIPENLKFEDLFVDCEIVSEPSQEEQNALSTALKAETNENASNSNDDFGANFIPQNFEVKATANHVKTAVKKADKTDYEDFGDNFTVKKEINAEVKKSKSDYEDFGDNFKAAVKETKIQSKAKDDYDLSVFEKGTSGFVIAGKTEKKEEKSDYDDLLLGTFESFSSTAQKKSSNVDSYYEFGDFVDKSKDKKEKSKKGDDYDGAFKDFE